MKLKYTKLVETSMPKRTYFKSAGSQSIQKDKNRIRNKQNRRNARLRKLRSPEVQAAIQEYAAKNSLTFRLAVEASTSDSTKD